MRAVVVALGDLGRSARMQYHAQALATDGVDVDLVGLEGTPLPQRLTDDPRITVHRLQGPRLTMKIRQSLSGSGYAAVGLFDALRLGLRLWRTLRRSSGPTSCWCRIRRRFRRSPVTWFSLHGRGVRFVIDWHNLGYTLLRLRLGQWHPAVRLARWFERRDARRVDANLCVSRGLAAFLESRFGVTNARVLYDRPAAAFVPMERTRSRAVPSGAVRPPGRAGADRRLRRLSHELDRGRRLRRRHRRGCAARGARSAAGKAAGRRPALPGSGDSRDRRRRAARGVRAAVRRAAGAADSSAGAVARA